MTGLKEGKARYKYRVGGLDSSLAPRRSKDFEFVTSPLSAPNEKTVFAMLADQVSGHGEEVVSRCGSLTGIVFRELLCFSDSQRRTS